MLKVIKMTNDHIKDAMALFEGAYEREKEHAKALPDFKAIKSLLNKRFDWMLKEHQGLVAIDNDKVHGYLLYVLGDELFGNQKCAFVPLFGHASIQDRQYQIYQSLYIEASKDWLDKKRLSWVVTSFEHDPVLDEFWFKNGFRQRCADAIAFPKISKNKNDLLTIKKANLNMLSDIEDLHRQHNAYYQEAPLCMPVDDSDPFKELLEWFEEDNHHLWIAYHKDQALGYMRIEKTGESFISLVDDMMSVTSAYVHPDKRHMGIASTLLNEIQAYLLNETQMKRYGVDYESMNPLARGFWETHFTPYTKSVARRIDEGILK